MRDAGQHKGQQVRETSGEPLQHITRDCLSAWSPRGSTEGDKGMSPDSIAHHVFCPQGIQPPRSRACGWARCRASILYSPIADCDLHRAFTTRALKKSAMETCAVERHCARRLGCNGCVVVRRLLWRLAARQRAQCSDVRMHTCAAARGAERPLCFERCRARPEALPMRRHARCPLKYDAVMVWMLPEPLA